MEEENRPTIDVTLKNIFHTFFMTLTDLANLATAEAILAGRSVIAIFQLMKTIKILLLLIWFSLCAALLLYAGALTSNWSYAFLAVALLNIIAIIVLGVILLKMKNNLFFPATRRQLKFSLKKDLQDEQIKARHKTVGEENSSAKV